MTPEEKRQWTAALDRNATALRDSAIFMQLWSDGIAKDPMACMQLGLCMMMDKPVHILAPLGTKIPENMQKVAHSIEFFMNDNMADLQRATEKVLYNANLNDKEST